MSIKIIKQDKKNERGDELYTAEVTAPNGTWKSPPLPSFELVGKLLRLGHSVFEIERAFWEIRCDHPPESTYNYAAKITRPFLQAALAGEREVPEQRPFTEAWLTDAPLYYDRMLSLREVIGLADAINHTIADSDEISGAFLRLRRRGWLAIEGEMYGLTPEGRRAAQEIVSRGKKPSLLLDRVRKLEKWFVDHPLLGDELMERLDYLSVR